MIHSMSSFYDEDGNFQARGPCQKIKREQEKGLKRLEKDKKCHEMR